MSTYLSVSRALTFLLPSEQFCQTEGGRTLVSLLLFLPPQHLLPSLPPCVHTRRHTKSHPVPLDPRQRGPFMHFLGRVCHAVVGGREAHPPSPVLAHTSELRGNSLLNIIFFSTKPAKVLLFSERLLFSDSRVLLIFSAVQMNEGKVFCR